MSCLYYAECLKVDCAHCKRNRDNEQEVRNAFADNFEESWSYKTYKDFSYGKADRVDEPELTDEEAEAIIQSGYAYRPKTKRKNKRKTQKLLEDSLEKILRDIRCKATR